MEKITAAFTKGRRAVVTGQGGFGKTQIANEYTHRHIADYDFICWVNAESKQSLENSYREFAAENGMPLALEGEFEPVLQFMKRWFVEYDSWLFIYDNAESLASTDDGLASLSYYLPGATATGNVLITVTRGRFHCHRARR